MNTIIVGIKRVEPGVQGVVVAMADSRSSLPFDMDSIRFRTMRHRIISRRIVVSRQEYLEMGPQLLSDACSRLRDEFGGACELSKYSDVLEKAYVVEGKVAVAFEIPAIDSWIEGLECRVEKLEHEAVDAMVASRLAVKEISTLKMENESCLELRKHWYGRLALWMIERSLKK